MTTAPKTEDLTVNGQSITPAKESGGTLQEQFAAWLASGQDKLFAYPQNYFCDVFMRVAKNKEFDYLYSQRDYRGQSIQRSENFRYAGIYCKADGLVYDARYSLYDFDDQREARNLVNLKYALETEVRKAVEGFIANNRNSLIVSELNEQEASQLEFFRAYRVENAARRAFIEDEDSSFPFCCDFNLIEWTENSLLDYISDPVAYVQLEAATYLNENQGSILRTFLENDALRKEYRIIVENPQHQAHYVKRIIKATTGTEAKTFRVTIRKDGKEFTFKAEADQFRCDSEYNYASWNIVAADRREFDRRFEPQFGRRDYYPEEITRIEYGRTVLYEADRAED